MLNIKSIVKEHIDVINELTLQSNVLSYIARVTASLLSIGKTLYTMGNGGSAADSQHIAAEIIGRFKKTRDAWPAIALTTDTSIITAVANDFGYEYIFDRQVKGLVKKDDVIWAISTSGESKNILKAAQSAKNQGAIVFGFTGQGGELAKIADKTIQVNHQGSDRVQEAHLLCYHIICEIIEETLAESSSK
jgi:D-sedoheptulose 7-phosphate isomerase